MNRPDLSVIVVHHRGQGHLIEALDAIAASSPGPAVETILVDNTAGKPMEEVLRRHPNLRRVVANRNVGFAAGCRLGAEAARAPLLAFVNDDANHTPQKIVLTGTGTDPKAVLSPSPLVFDPQVVNTTSTERTETISNPGVGALHISTLALSGPSAADYAITSDGCSHTAVAAGSSCQLKVTFSPSDLGTRSATLTVRPGEPDLQLCESENCQHQRSGQHQRHQ